MDATKDRNIKVIKTLIKVDRDRKNMIRMLERND
jgi:hypothetical protein